MSPKPAGDRRVADREATTGNPRPGTHELEEAEKMQGSWRHLKLWTAPVRNLTWVNAQFGHR
jgi:hypothetical protein